MSPPSGRSRCLQAALLVVLGIAHARALLGAFGSNCTLRASCRLSPDMTSYHMNCACDASCALYGDCCADEADRKKPFPTRLEESELKRMRCVNDARLDRRFPVYILQSCVANYPEGDVRRKCEGVQGGQPRHLEDMYGYVPVTGLRSGILYRNSYCALCNNEKYFVFWRVKVSTNDAGLLRSVKTEDLARSDWAAVSHLKLQVEFSHPLYKAHMCKNPISSCAPTWEDDAVRRACAEEPAEFVYRYHDTYRNRKCAVCNFADDASLTCIDGRPLLHSPNIVFREPPSFSILLDLDAGRLTREERSAGGKWQTREEVIDVTCDAGFVFDPFTAKCRQLYCQPGSVLDRQGQCISSSDGDATCPMVSFRKGEFEYVGNGSVYVPGLDRTYPPGEHWSDGADVLVCNPDWGRVGHNVTRNVTQWESFFRSDPVQGWLTLALNLVSILGLSLQLLVYSCFPPLRNTPGKCLMCLSASLLVSQLLFIVGVHQNENEALCRAIAVFLHYGFLAYFFWMNTMAFDIYHAFGGKSTSKSFYSSSSSSGGRISRRFLLYSLYSWVSPAGVVLLAGIFEAARVEAVRPDYGKAFCWFGSSSGQLVFFVLPIAALLIADTVFFSLTVREIHKVSENTKRLQKNKVEQRRLGLYVKLALVMGLTWMLGFVATLLRNTIVWYIYVIINSLQGLWIFITFVCTAKVWNMVRGKYTKYRSSLAASSSAGADGRTRSTIMSEYGRPHSMAGRKDIRKDDYKDSSPHQDPATTESLLKKPDATMGNNKGTNF